MRGTVGRFSTGAKQSPKRPNRLVGFFIRWIPGALSPRGKAVGASLNPFYVDTMKCGVYLFHICLHGMDLYFNILYFTLQWPLESADFWDMRFESCLKTPD